MTTYQEISDWFDDGVTDEQVYMVVWVDEYDMSDYPTYYDDEESAQESIDNPHSMQRVMEVYDLSLDRDTQLDQNRAMALRPAHATLDL